MMTDTEKLATLIGALTDTTYDCLYEDCENRVTLGIKVGQSRTYHNGEYGWEPYEFLSVYGCPEHDEWLNEIVDRPALSSLSLEGGEYRDCITLYKEQFYERGRLAELIGIELELPRFADME